MDGKTTEPLKSFRRTLFLPLLLLCFFLIWSISYFVSTLLINVSASFNVPIGTASQFLTIATITGLIVGLAMSALAIRYKHRSLFIFGVALYPILALIWSFAPNFATAALASVLAGVGGAMITIMAYTLIGEHLPLEKRGWAMGLFLASIMASALVVAPLSGFIAGISGWRMVPLEFIFPMSIVCLVLAVLVVPSNQPQPNSEAQPSFVQAVKRIFTQISPIACLVSTAMIAFVVFPYFAVSFLRIAFSLSPTYAGLCMSMAAAVGIVGGVAGGRLVNRIGRKPLAITSALFFGLSALIFTFMPTVAFSVLAWALNAFAGGLYFTGLPSLNLEQVPEYRGSMMSIANSFDNAGTILGLSVAGLVLNLYASFHLVYVIFGVVGLATVPVLFFFAKDPCKRV